MARKLNVCVLLDGPIINDGRVKRIIYSLCNEYNVDLFYISGTERDKTLFNNNVDIHSCASDSSWINYNLLFSNKYNSLKETVLSKKKHYDIIYCNDYPLLKIAVDLKRKFEKSKLVYDAHEYYVEIFNQFFPMNGLKAVYGFFLKTINKVFHSIKERQLIDEVDLFITVSESIRIIYEKKFGIKNSLTLRNCPNLGLESIKSNRIREFLNLSEDKFILLYQGTYNQGRGLELIIKVSEGLDKTIHIVFIGSGPLEVKLKNLSSFNQNIHFIDSLEYEDLMKFIGSADMGLMLIEPFNLSKKLCLPNKFFEYMATGLPILASNLPEFESLILQSNSGVIMDISNVEGMRNTINTLAKSPNKELLNQMGYHGRKMYETRYNWETEVVPFEKKIKELISSV